MSGRVGTYNLLRFVVVDVAKATKLLGDSLDGGLGKSSGVGNRGSDDKLAWLRV